MKLAHAVAVTGGITLLNTPLLFNLFKLGKTPFFIKGKITSDVDPSIPITTSFFFILFFKVI